jgi:hypothetical protein
MKGDHQALLNVFGKTVSIVFAEQADAKDASLLLRRLLALADDHNQEFHVVLDEIEDTIDTIDHLVKIRNEERPFRERLDREQRPSGVG